MVYLLDTHSAVVAFCYSNYQNVTYPSEPRRLCAYGRERGLFRLRTVHCARLWRKAPWYLKSTPSREGCFESPWSFLVLLLDNVKDTGRHDIEMELGKLFGDICSTGQATKASTHGKLAGGLEWLEALRAFMPRRRKSFLHFLLHLPQGNSARFHSSTFTLTMSLRLLAKLNALPTASNALSVCRSQRFYSTPLTKQYENIHVTSPKPGVGLGMLPTGGALPMRPLTDVSTCSQSL